MRKQSKRQLWLKKSKNYRQEHPCCEVCGSTEHLNVHHILSRKFYPQYMFDDDNLVCLCAKHHNFCRLSAHKNGIWFAEWLKEHDKKKYDKAVKRVKVV